ncbi:hypothetical protein BM526_10655 [Alteromonas mediterranea]|uniref:hypothetical protein n=1 Tax=Alteromonas mediterranea TaxID=314275 RepID=UPI00090403E0|nr:hypothetical protein [Alteromonas mediterranea]APE02268.1 hypothetical protein BM526_10655 [Alteromonas mediterranea]
MDTFEFCRTKYRLATGFALCLFSFYITSLKSALLSWVLSITILIFVVDMLLINRALDGFCKQYQRTNLDAELTSYLKSKLKFPLLYRLLKNEMFVVFYGFFARHFSPPLKQPANTVSYAKSANAKDVFWLVFIAQIPTLPFIHFILDKEGNAFAAWTVSALTLWSVIYYRAQVQAVKWSPIKVSDSHLHFRYGLSCSADIPLANIKSVSRLNSVERYDSFSHYVSPIGSNENTLLEFDSKVTFYSAYDLLKRRKKAVISVDDPQKLIELIEKAS